jgi:hypothetical protein
LPPNGLTAIEPGVVHVALVTAKPASKPATIFIEGNVPHLGLIVAEFKGQISLLLDEVHAKNKLISLNDLPHGYDIVPKFTRFIEFLIIGPLQSVFAVLENTLPSALTISKVPQYAKDVLVEPVLLLIDKNNVLVIVLAVHVPHASSPGLGGRVAPTNIKSPDVHKLAAGRVCATAVPEKSKIKNKKILVNALILKA